jgi:hypothetical protein
MKHLSKILLVLFLAVSTTSFSQALKFGHLNTQELVALMPDRDSAAVKLENILLTLTKQWRLCRLSLILN